MMWQMVIFMLGAVCAFVAGYNVGALSKMMEADKKPRQERKNRKQAYMTYQGYAKKFRKD